MKNKLEWPFNLMADVNKKITDENQKLPECKEDAPTDLLAVVSYIFTDIACTGIIQSLIRGASSILCHYRDGMTLKDIAYDLDVSRTAADNYIHKVLDLLARNKRYHDLLKYGMWTVMRQAEMDGMKRGRNLGYREGYFDGTRGTHEYDYKRGYVKGYNDGICGMQNRINSITKHTPIEDCNFSIRTYNCLKRSAINTVEQLVGMTMNDLLGIRNMGRKSADEVAAFIKQFKAMESLVEAGENRDEAIERIAKEIIADAAESDTDKPTEELREKVTHDDKPVKPVVTAKVANYYTEEELAELKAKQHENAKRLYEAEKEALGLNKKED